MAKTKKIVIDARESGTSSGRYVDKLVEHLYKLQPNYRIVLLAKPARIAYLSSVAPKFQIVESPIKEFTFSEQIRLAKQINGLQADLVHFTFPQQPILYGGKTITTMHDLTTLRFNNPSKNRLVFTAKQFIYGLVIKIAVRKAEAVLAISEYTKDAVAKYAHINSRKVTVTLEAADPINDEPEPVEGINPDAPFIMYVGRPTPHKNLNRLIDAFVMLQTTHPDLQLVLAGKRDTLYKRIERSSLSAGLKNILFTDFISDGQLRWLYENCAAYVFPSLSEGFGLPGLEAMMHGAPVVSSNTTSLPEVHGDAAEYFDPLDPFAIASAIARVIDDPKRSAWLREAGKAQAKTFSWKRCAEQTLAVYKEVLGE